MVDMPFCIQQDGTRVKVDGGPEIIYHDLI